MCYVYRCTRRSPSKMAAYLHHQHIDKVAPNEPSAASDEDALLRDRSSKCERANCSAVHKTVDAIARHR